MISSFLLSVLISLLIFYSVQKLLKFCKHSERENVPKKWRHERFTHFKIPNFLLDALYMFYQFRKYGVQILPKWAKKYDHDVVLEVSVGLWTVLGSQNAELSHKLLKSTEPGHLTRPLQLYHLFFPNFLSKGLFGTDYGVWVHQRRAIARAFTYRHIIHYLRIMNKHSKIMVSELLNLAQENGGIAKGPQLHNILKLRMLKITLEFVFGSDKGDSKEALDFANHVIAFRDISAYRIMHPELYFPPLWWIHPKKRKLDTIFKNMNMFVTQVIQHHQEKLASEEGKILDKYGPKCLIEEMLRQNATPEEIYAETGTFLFAGYETVSGAIKFLTQHLACHPEYQARSREEVDHLLGPYDLQSDMKHSFGIDELSKLKYMERVIYESLRITPVVPLIMRELKSPLEVDENYTMKKGSLVAASVFFIHHNPRYYPDPMKYDPDRFLPEAVYKRGPGTFIAFSTGMRNCIGRRFAMLEMKCVMARLLRNFEIYTEDGMFDIKIYFEGTLVPERNYRISLKIRDFDRVK